MAVCAPAASSEVTCILNASVGSVNAEAGELLKRIFAESGKQAHIVLAKNGSDIPALASRAVKEKSQPIIAGGGDGTLSAVATVLVGTGIALGVLPLGTLNHFAKDLHIPLDIEGAVNNIFTGNVASIDVGEVNGRIFLNNSNLGIYPRVVQKREHGEKQGYTKWIAFAQAVVSVMRHYSVVQVRLCADKEDEGTRKTPFVFVGNNKYELEGLECGTRTILDGGLLCVYTANVARRSDLLRLALKALFRRLKDNDIEALEAKEIWVQAKEKRLNVATDGEVNFMDTPLHYRTVPGALRVIVPAKNGSGSKA
jgi:diacylglycerol kinase family enzyme